MTPANDDPKMIDTACDECGEPTPATACFKEGEVCVCEDCLKRALSVLSLPQAA